MQSDARGELTTNPAKDTKKRDAECGGRMPDTARFGRRTDRRSPIRRVRGRSLNTCRVGARRSGQRRQHHLSIRGDAVKILVAADEEVFARQRDGRVGLVVQFVLGKHFKLWPLIQHQAHAFTSEHIHPTVRSHR
jgi:hypothetical protein